MPIQTVNPATEEVLETFEELTAGDIDASLSLARNAAGPWRRESIENRAQIVARMGDILLGRKQAYGEMMTREMGKPIGAARDEVTKCADACHYFASNAARFLAREKIDIAGEQAWAEFHPLGVVLAVMPWNFPFWQAIRFMAPALCAGNVGLLKHASNVPQCALALEELVRAAGAPEGVFQTLLIGSKAVEGIIADPRVAAVTLTGSNAAGEAVGSQAGKAIKKSVLELGGSDAFIVMPSADIDAAAATAVRARAINNGQSCIAAKRFIVHAAVYEPFMARFVAGMKSLVVGDPMDEKTQIGPLATKAIRDELHSQVQRSLHSGARLVTGGKPRDGKGWYYEPTVIADAPRDSAVLREETFGPVAVVVRVKDADEAIRVANDSQFGLGAAAWTKDAGEARRFADEIEAGTVVFNAMVASDSRAPFGGVKQSGYGRELSVHGMREFQNIKTIRARDVAV
jgi:succinate-semialdehyde dehydrogenase/glutarate-semialdehyde dehydrogenase